jgi:hypothetical protein
MKAPSALFVMLAVLFSPDNVSAQSGDPPGFAAAMRQCILANGGRMEGGRAWVFPGDPKPDGRGVFTFAETQSVVSRCEVRVRRQLQR